MSDITIIDETMVEVQYTPTTTQMEIKKKFWAKYKSQTGYKVGDVPSRAIIQRIVKNQASTVYKQWDTPGFKEWFLNDTKFEQILYEHEEEVLIRLLSIIKDPEAKNGDKLKAMGMYLEMSGRFKKKEAIVVSADKDIGSMSAEQIKQELQKASEILEPESS